MRVLLTGHKGYIGAVMARMFVEAGHDVMGLDSDLFERCTFYDDLVAIPELRKDVRDVEPRDLDGFDAVVHLAGLSNDPIGDLNPAVTYEINHAASVRLARMAKDAGVARFVFSSTCSNYGTAGDDFIDENAPLQPITPYAESKVWVERDVATLADARFSPVFLRSATAYGASPRLRFDLALNNLTAWALTTGRVHLKSDGTPWRPIVHIEDISRAFLAVVQAPRDAVHNEAFNVGVTAENFRIRELATLVAEAVPNARVEYAPGAGPDRRCYRVDFTKIETRVPEFRPQWTARRGVQELLVVYRREGLALEEFEGPKYKRIDHLKALLRDGVLDERLRPRAANGASVRTEGVTSRSV